MKKVIPNKLFYKIGEVAQMTDLEPYVLRYWESEFGLRLTKSKNNQRLYQKKDIDQIRRIRQLLYEEKFTIAGAKRKMREKGKDAQTTQLALNLSHSEHASKQRREALLTVKEELEGFLATLREITTPTNA